MRGDYRVVVLGICQVDVGVRELRDIVVLEGIQNEHHGAKGVVARRCASMYPGKTGVETGGGVAVGFVARDVMS